MTDAFSDLRKILSDLGYPAEAITADTRIDALDADSLALAEIVIEIETRLGTDLPDDTFERAVTVGDLAEMIDAYPEESRP